MSKTKEKIVMKVAKLHATRYTNAPGPGLRASMRRSPGFLGGGLHEEVSRRRSPGGSLLVSRGRSPEGVEMLLHLGSLIPPHPIGPPSSEPIRGAAPPSPEPIRGGSSDPPPLTLHHGDKKKARMRRMMKMVMKIVMEVMMKRTLTMRKHREGETTHHTVCLSLTLLVCLSLTVCQSEESRRTGCDSERRGWRGGGGRERREGMEERRWERGGGGGGGRERRQGRRMEKVGREEVGESRGRRGGVCCEECEEQGGCDLTAKTRRRRRCCCCCCCCCCVNDVFCISSLEPALTPEARDRGPGTEAPGPRPRD